jgi:hypothetical protein
LQIGVALPEIYLRLMHRELLLAVLNDAWPTIVNALGRSRHRACSHADKNKTES